MLKFKSILVFGILIFISSPSVMAKNDVGQGRLFFGATKVNPDEVNAELTAQNLKNVETINQAGIEITFPTLEYLHLGLRYARHFANQSEATPDPATDFIAEITQDSLLGVARIPFFRSDHVYMDAFAGVGASNTTYTEKAVAQDGKLEASTTPYYAAGASIAFGYKKYFVFFEGGVETNKIDDLKRSGTINSNINTIDLSGTYFMVGFMFDGIPIFTK